MTLTEDQCVQLAAVRMENAQQALQDARRLLDAGSLRGAANRAYYAMFFAASALSVSRGVSFKKHATLIGFFQKEFVRGGLLDRSHGRSLQKAFDDRSEADYEDFVQFTEEQIRTRLAEAEAFTEAVRTCLQVGRR